MLITIARAMFRAMVLSRAPFIGLGATGVIWGAFAAMVPAIKTQAGASDAQFGTAILASAAGGMLAMALSPRLVARFGHQVLPGAAICAALAVLLPVFALSPFALFSVMFGLGASMSGLDICCNLRVVDLENQHGAHLMNLNHAMFSASFAIAALGVGLMRRAGWVPAQVFPLICGLVLIMALGMRTAPNVKSQDDMAITADEALPWDVILPVAIMMFAAFVTENAVETWSALFLERDLNEPMGAGGFGPAMLGAIMALFRLIGHETTRRFGDARVVFWSGVFAVCGVLILAQAPVRAVALAGIALTAVGMAVIVPSATSLLGKAVPRHQRNLAISRAWMIGFAGFFIGPVAVGVIAETYGLRVAFVGVAGIAGMILPAILWVGRR